MHQQCQDKKKKASLLALYIDCKTCFSLSFFSGVKHQLIYLGCAVQISAPRIKVEIPIAISNIS